MATRTKAPPQPARAVPAGKAVGRARAVPRTASAPLQPGGRAGGPAADPPVTAAELLALVGRANAEMRETAAVVVARGQFLEEALTRTGEDVRAAGETVAAAGEIVAAAGECMAMARALVARLDEVTARQEGIAHLLAALGHGGLLPGRDAGGPTRGGAAGSESDFPALSPPLGGGPDGPGLAN